MSVTWEYSVTFVTATCRKDVHYVRALLASIHAYYPDHRKVVFTDRDVPKGAIRALDRFPNTSVRPVGQFMADHKLSLTGLLTKLNMFFDTSLDRIVYCDADSVMIGPVLERLVENEKDFVSFNGRWIGDNDSEMKSFSKYALDVGSLCESDRHLLVMENLYYFQSSHFYARCGSFPVSYIIDNRTRLNTSHGHPGVFRAGDQGLFNYVLNKHHIPMDRFRSDHIVLQAYGPDSQSMEIDIPYLTTSCTYKSKYFVHYLGPSRRYFLKAHRFGAVLDHYWRDYYRLNPASSMILDEVRRGLLALRSLVGACKRKCSCMPNSSDDRLNRP
jgi:hypothetical protein